MRLILLRTKKQAKAAYNTEPKSFEREDIIDWLIGTDFVDNYVLKLMFNSDYEDKDDITQDIWLIILEIPQEKWNSVSKLKSSLDIIRYVSGLIYRQISSTSSSIYMKYKGYKEHYINIDDQLWDYYDKTNNFN